MENEYIMSVNSTLEPHKTSSSSQPFITASPPAAHYLVDTENMGRDWVEFVLSDHESAVYHVFYTENSPAIQIDCIEQMMLRRDQIRFIKCHTGHNALDFQLVTHLGYMLANAPKDEYHIVSKDTGYNAVVAFWMDRGAEIDRIEQLNTLPTTTLSAFLNLEQLCWNAVKEIATETEAKEIAEIIQTVTASETLDYKTVIHTKLVKAFSQAKGCMIYHACKNAIEQAHSNNFPLFAQDISYVLK